MLTLVDKLPGNLCGGGQGRWYTGRDEGRYIYDIFTVALWLRRERGLSQEKLGEALGVSWQTVSKWELGETTRSWKSCICSVITFRFHG